VNWRTIDTRPTEDCKSFLVALPKNDMADYIILQVSNFEGNMYPDHLNGLIDWSDRVLTATHWCNLIDAPREQVTIEIKDEIIKEGK